MVQYGLFATGYGEAHHVPLCCKHFHKEDIMVWVTINHGEKKNTKYRLSGWWFAALMQMGDEPENRHMVRAFAQRVGACDNVVPTSRVALKLQDTEGKHVFQ